MPTIPTVWPGWPSQSALILPLPVAKWAPPPAAVTIDDIVFRPKRELHVTLIGRRLGREILADPGRARYRAKTIREAFARQDWRYERTGMRYRLQRHEIIADDLGRDVGSIIELIDMPAMARFYRAVGALLGNRLPVPPPHVTIYTTGRAQGLCVPDERTLQAVMVREVALRELRQTLRQRAPKLPGQRAGSPFHAARKH